MSCCASSQGQLNFFFDVAFVYLVRFSKLSTNAHKLATVTNIMLRELSATTTAYVRAYSGAAQEAEAETETGKGTRAGTARGGRTASRGREAVNRETVAVAVLEEQATAATLAAGARAAAAAEPGTQAAEAAAGTATHDPMTPIPACPFAHLPNKPARRDGTATVPLS